MATNPFIKGKNVRLTLQLAQEDGASKNMGVIQATNFTLKPNLTEIADGILGADRDDIDVELNFFDVSFDVLSRDLKLLRAFLSLQRARDLKIAMAESALGFLVQPNDGTTSAFQVRKYVPGAWEFNVGGRTERIKTPVPGRALYFEELPAI